MSDAHRPIGILTTDARLIIRSWDAWLEQATGISTGQAAGQSLAALVPDFEVRGLAARFRQVLDEAAVQVLVPAFHGYLIPCPPRPPSPHFSHMQQHTTVVPLREGDRVVGTLVMIEDVTGRLDRERELADQLHDPDEQARLRAAQELAATGTAYAGQPALGGALGDTSWRVRRAAVKGLARDSEPGIVGRVLQALRDGHHDLGVLSGALQILSLTHADVVAPLVELLGSPDAELRSYAALALGERRDARAIEALIAAIHDPDPNVGYHAIEALGKLQAVEAAEPLLELVQERDFFLAFPALDALISLGDARVAPALVPLLEDDLLRARAAEALGRLGDDHVVGPLAELLARPDAPGMAVAQALSTLYGRYQEIYGEGEYIADLARQAIDNAGRGRLVAALAAVEGEALAAPVQVIGWLDGIDVDRLLVALLAQPEARSAAVEALVRRGRGVTPLLLDQLESQDVEVRHAAAIALGRIGDERAVPALTRMLSDDAGQAIITVGALARIGDRSAFDTMIGLLSHPNAATRQAAVAAINSLGHPDLPRVVAGLLGDPDPLVRESACRIAGYYGYPEFVEGLLALATNDPEETVRAVAVDHLPYLDDPRGVPVLARVLGGETARVRAAAARALGHVEGDDALPILLQALDDHDLWVRYFAARSLGRLGQAKALDTLARLCEHDPAPPVRIAAIEAIGEVGGAEAVALLAPLSRAEDRDIARAALGALGGIDHPDALPPLLAALRSGDPAHQVDAIHALRERGGPGVAGALQWVAATEPDMHPVQLAVDALAHLGTAESAAALLTLAADVRCRPACIAALAGLNEKAIPWVARGLRDPQVPVRVAVVDALARMKRPEASEQIGTALDDPEPAVRLAAAIDLGQLSSSQARARLARLARSDPDPAVRQAAQDALES